MDETLIALPDRLEPARAKALLDAVLAEAGLRVTMRDTLRQCPGCVHWHAKRDRKRGTAVCPPRLIPSWSADRTAS